MTDNKWGTVGFLLLFAILVATTITSSYWPEYNGVIPLVGIALVIVSTAFTTTMTLRSGRRERDKTPKTVRSQIRSGFRKGRSQAHDDK